MEDHVINTLHNLIDYEISRFLSAEVELKNCLPKWIDQANSLQLKTIVQKYLEFVNQHIVRIEEFIAEQQIGMVSISNPIMQAFIKDTDESLSYCENADIKDACLLACIQGINHYKICAYGKATSYADLLELEKDAKVFYEAEINEKHIDDHLSQLAKYEVNVKAKSPTVEPK